MISLIVGEFCKEREFVGPIVHRIAANWKTNALRRSLLHSPDTDQLFKLGLSRGRPKIGDMLRRTAVHTSRPVHDLSSG